MSGTMPLRAVLLAALLAATSRAHRLEAGDMVCSLSAGAVDTIGRPAEHRELLSRLERVQHQLTDVQERLDTPPPSAECPAGWSRHNGFCYLIPAATTTSWFGATAACPAIDSRARLASVRLENSQFLDGLVANSDADYVWAGGVQTRKGGAEWVWQDGAPLDYTNWAQGQPNPTQDHCVCLQGPRSTYAAKVGQWHNGSSCIESSYHFLCQINLR